MENVFRPSRMRNGKRVRSRMYRGRYTIGENPHVFDVPLKTTDKQVATAKLRATVLEREKEAAGLVPARSLRDGAEKALSAHLADYIADLECRGKSHDYVRHINERVSALIAACGWRHIADITADSFERWRTVKEAAPKTLNAYRSDVTAFLKWLRDHRRASDNPLDCVKPVEARGRETYHRRALSAEECDALLAVAGPRRLLYLMALCTGLRRGEIAALRWDDIDLDAARPIAIVRAATSKNRREAPVDLHPCLVDELRAARPESPEVGALVFPAGVPRNRDLRTDYTRAGIPLMDSAGRKMDFHALRHTLCTLLQVTGATPREAMAAMRHSDMRLTQKVYTDANALRTREAILRLPFFTDSRPDSRNASQPPVPPGLDQSRRVAEATETGSVQVATVERVRRVEAHRVAACQVRENGGGGGNRTPVREGVTLASTRVSRH